MYSFRFEWYLNAVCSLYVEPEDRPSLPSTPNHLRSMAERDARAMEAAARAMEEATKRMEEAATSQANQARSLPSSTGSSITTTAPALSKADPDLPMKRLPTGEEEKLMAAHMGMPNAHLKITSRSKYQTNIIDIYKVNI